MALSDLQANLQRQKTSMDARLKAAREQGRQEGREEALRELLPQMEAIASEAMVKQSAAREVFRSQVTVHSMAAELVRMKTSMSNNLCWQCGARPPSAASRFRRCHVCDNEG